MSQCVVGVSNVDALRRFCEAQGYEWISDDISVQLRYTEMRVNGQSHNMAELLALRKFPGTRTDVEFNRGHCNGNQFGESEVSQRLGDYYRRVAEIHGQNTVGKVYHSGLAKFSGDPRAWISSRGEAEALLHERGWSSQGLVNVKPTINDVPDDGPTVDPRLILDEVTMRTATGQMLGCRDAEELSHKLIELRRPRTDAETQTLEARNIPDHVPLPSEVLPE